MGSEKLWTACKCGRNISISLKECPECGAKISNPGRSKWNWVLGIFIALVVIGNLSSERGSRTSDRNPAQVKNEIETAMPRNQKVFISTVEKYSKSFSTASNELQQSLLRDNRKAEFSKVLPSFKIKDWTGTLSSLETNSDGKAIVSIKISPNVQIRTWNNAISDFETNSLIEKTSPVYKELLNLSNGQKVIFSGNFFPSEQDYIKESSLTISGSMSSPEYIFNFHTIKAIQ